MQSNPRACFDEIILYYYYLGIILLNCLCENGFRCGNNRVLLLIFNLAWLTLFTASLQSNINTSTYILAYLLTIEEKRCLVL